jgi:sugar diacid utilization regulator
MIRTAHQNSASTVSALLRGAADPFSGKGTLPSSQRSLLSWPIIIILVELNGLSEDQTSRAVRNRLPEREAIFTFLDNELVIITNTSSPYKIANALWEEFRTSFRRECSVVISSPITALENVPAVYHTLRNCFELLRRINGEGKVVFERTISIYRCLFNDIGADAIESFIRSTIGVIVDYDKRRRGQLAPTLLAFFDNGRSLQKTADRLGIHVNTVRQRLEAITELSHDWDHPSRCLEVHIALRMQALMSRRHDALCERRSEEKRASEPDLERM